MTCKNGFTFTFDVELHRSVSLQQDLWVHPEISIWSREQLTKSFLESHFPTEQLLTTDSLKVSLLPLFASLTL